ncbi:hypothetical protein Bbelb_184050 [Branchiostoma belcheri]|nr:hypothetical protein Bbelb_184050 [Branchiostoma belcheri]
MQVKPESFEKYEDFYLNGSVSLSERSGVLNVRDIVDNNRRKFETNREEIEEARKEVENNSGGLDDAWAQIFPVQEQERSECQDMQEKVQHFDDGGCEDDDIPDLAKVNKSKEQNFTLERCQLQVTLNTALPLMQSLNRIQQNVFYFVRKWCMEMARGKRPEPFRVFVTGGAGTGKSHVIKCIYYEATRILQQTQENPDKVSVLLTAPTGTAAFNIGGSTLHHAFHLSMNYDNLKEKTVNTLRAQYESLKIVIIDEVSMVKKKLLQQIHSRLCQLTQGHPDAFFGNVSILAVGDMYQIPPVRGKSLHKERKTDIFDLWNPIFEVVELKEIMRQKDDAAFAELLNRLRVKRKKQKLADEDDKTLSSRVLSLDFAAEEYPKDALHIFTKNDFVAEHNDRMLNLRCSHIRRYEASDFVKDPCTGSMKRRHLAAGESDDLPDVVRVGVGARVMLCRNVNVEDGLVNGAFGTVTGVKGGDDHASEDATVYVLFDNPRAGAVERQKSSVPNDVPVNSVPVHQFEGTLKHLSKVHRYQIPLKLAWACTTHKVQGMTTDEATGHLFVRKALPQQVPLMEEWQYMNEDRKPQACPVIGTRGKTTSLSSDWDEGGKPQACPVIRTWVENHKLVQREVNYRAPPVIGEEEGQSSPRDWGGGRREVRAPPVIGEERGKPQSSPRDWGGGRVQQLEDPAQNIQQIGPHVRKQSLVQEKLTGEEPD